MSQQGDADEPPAAEANAPMRDEMLQNAVTFLSHSQVRGSSDEKKRAFLVQKGLTDAEIEEAFKRVPAAPPVSTSVGARPFPPPAPSRTLPPPPPPPPPSSMALLPATVQRMRWTQMVLAVGALSAGTWYAASCARRLMRSSSAVRQLTPVIAAAPPPSSSRAEVQVVQEVQQLRTTMTDAISSQNQQLAATTKALEALAAAQREEAEAKRVEAEAQRKEAVALPETVAKASLAGMDTVKQELRRLTDSCAALASATTSRAESPTTRVSPIPGELYSELGEIRSLLKQTLRTQSPFHPQSPSSPRAGSASSLSFKSMLAATAAATQTTEEMNKSTSAATVAMAAQNKALEGAEAAATVKAKALTLAAQARAEAAVEVKARTVKAEAAANAKAITDAAVQKKAEVAKRVEALTQAASIVKAGTESSPAKAEAENRVKQLTASAEQRVRGPGGSPPAAADEPKYSKSYTEVMDMLTAGETPPGIREIDDRPPNPGRALPTASLKPRPKPWEKATNSGGSEALPWTTTAGEQAMSDRVKDGGETTWKPPPRPGVAMATAAEAMGMGKGGGGGVSVGRAPPTAAEKAKGPAAEQAVDQQKTRATRRTSRKALQLSDSSSDEEEV